MSFTVPQKLSVFECLGVTYGPGGGSSAANATLHNGFGVLLTLSQMDQLRTEVNNLLDNMAIDQETAVKELVVEWDAVRLQTAEVTGGSIGSATSVTYSAAGKRERIRQLMTVYVPIFTIAQSMKQREGESRIGCNISVSR